MKKTNKKTNKKNTVSRIKLYVAGITLGAGLGLAGCEEVESKPVTSEVVSEIESEEVSEVVSEVEVPTEEVSEEVSEEVVEKDAYSVDGVNSFINDICANYQYENEEQIRAAVIAMNIDYIAEEDLETLMDGKSPKEMEDILEGYFEEYHSILFLNRGAIVYQEGESSREAVNEKDLENRVKMYDLYIGQENAKKTLKAVEEGMFFCNDEEKLCIYAAYILPDEYSSDECPGNYKGDNLTDNNVKFINYYIVTTQLMSHDKHKMLKENMELPYNQMDIYSK